MRKLVYCIYTYFMYSKYNNVVCTALKRKIKDKHSIDDTIIKGKHYIIILLFYLSFIL